jgi:signal transduction histidine kinase
VQIEREIANLRAIITELRPAALDELGLAAALDALFARHRSINDLEIVEELTLPDGEDAAGGLDADIAATVYRVVQEALTNVAKHSQARVARVAVRLAGEQVLIEVADDGRGFDPANRRSGGYGLQGMRERVAATGGALAIDSSPVGTTVSAALPLSQRRGFFAGPLRGRDGQVRAERFPS